MKIHQEEITIFNLYEPNVSSPSFFKHTLKDLKPHTVIVGDFNMPLPRIARSSRQKINKGILELNDTIDLMELTDVYILQQHNIHSSQQPMGFTKIDHIIGHKANLNKYKKTEVTPCILYCLTTIQ
jgi:endonuclease/exonuclease/phosphatase family metal-dependent hydrolase